jgi:hypothetical protein
MTLSLLAVLVVSQNFDGRLTEQALKLAGPDRVEAEKALNADPEGAAGPLSVVVRAQGVSALRPLVRELGCPMMGPSILREDANPATAAVKVLSGLAARHDVVRQRLARSGSGLEKLLLVAGLWNDEPALASLATTMEAPALNDAERGLLKVLQACTRLGRRNGEASGLVLLLARLDGATPKTETCADAASATALLKQGPIEATGWASSNGSFTFQLKQNTVRIEATAECMVELATQRADPASSYAAAYQLGRSEQPLSARALDVLERDLETYPKEKREQALRVLIGGGRVLGKLSEFTVQDIGFDDGLLRGAVLARHPQATALVIERASCPFMGRDVKLLSLLPKAVATTEAARLVETCSKVRGEAVEVLLELGDSRWAKWAPALVADSFDKRDLEAALKRRWSATLKSQLTAVPSNDPSFAAWRAAFLTNVEKAGSRGAQ